MHALCEAVKSRDILGLVQVYADGVDLTEKIPLANGHVSVVNFIKQIVVTAICIHSLKIVWNNIWNTVLNACPFNDIV